MLFQIHVGLDTRKVISTNSVDTCRQVLWGVHVTVDTGAASGLYSQRVQAREAGLGSLGSSWKGQGSIFVRDVL